MSQPYYETMYILRPDIPEEEVESHVTKYRDIVVEAGGEVLDTQMRGKRRLAYPIRFNVLQAILIDIVLVLLSLAFRVLLGPLGDSFAVRTLQNTVFLGALVLCLFTVVQSLRGQEADIPTVSEAVRLQLY